MPLILSFSVIFPLLLLSASVWSIHSTTDRRELHEPTVQPLRSIIRGFGSRRHPIKYAVGGSTSEELSNYPGIIVVVQATEQREQWLVIWTCRVQIRWLYYLAILFRLLQRCRGDLLRFGSYTLTLLRAKRRWVVWEQLKAQNSIAAQEL
ncbi:hypothetical protein EV368DRAFT_69417 [Lentinula lateritia]|nr:hypothetical protein EV368DRAFT_69417 [Lentinula lateritia]